MGYESKIVRAKIIIENRHYNLDQAYKFLDDLRKGKSGYSENQEKMDDSDASSVFSNSSASSKKRERQESKSPEERKEQKKINKLIILQAILTLINRKTILLNIIQKVQTQPNQHNNMKS